MSIRRRVAVCVFSGLALCLSAMAEPLDLTAATVVVRDAEAPEAVAATVLSEEVAGRTGLAWKVADSWPAEGPAVAVAVAHGRAVDGRPVPEGAAPDRAEGYAIRTDISDPGRPVVWVVGADRRGALFGVGKLLRAVDAVQGKVSLSAPLNLTSAPVYPMRGHQLGFRARANSWDAWTVDQFDRHIRELALFGTNAIENIPFQDKDDSRHFKVSRRDMNREMSRICDQYDLEYWVWTPAEFDLKDAKLRAESLAQHEQLYADCPRMDGVFFPGGDPGSNPSELVMPFIADVAKVLARYHPKAKVWMSLQGFEDADVDHFYKWIAKEKPDWFGGAVAGPSSPPIAETRARLPREHALRHYPDITHSVRAQYPVGWIDPAFAFTLGRECVNPRPVAYSYIHNTSAPYTVGFISYSDGVHDDFNKALWSALAWDPAQEPRSIAIDYARQYFRSDVAETAADGILCLERNWEGAAAQNGGIDATLALWQGLEARAPELAGNWRWQLCLLRAYYDAYVRHRLIHETALENEANARMAEASATGADAAMDAALAVLKRAETEPVRPELRARVVDLCEALFQSIGLQTSVPKYGASGAERGAVLDYLDYPLNNRWWLEDEIGKVRALGSEEAKRARLLELANWENPGPGGYYDDIGNVAQSAHVIRGEQINTVGHPETLPVPDFMWWDNGLRRVRQSWISKMDWPLGLRYFGLDPEADYVLRTTGNGQCLVRVNGSRLVPTIDGKQVGEIKEFPIPRRLYREGTITLTFDVPYEPGINWREASRLNEVWLLKK